MGPPTLNFACPGGFGGDPLPVDPATTHSFPIRCYRSMLATDLAAYAASVTLLATTVGRPSADADEAYGQEQQPQVWCP